MYLGLALISCGILALVISIWQYQWTARYLRSGSFARVAGLKEGMQSPVHGGRGPPHRDRPVRLRCRAAAPGVAAQAGHADRERRSDVDHVHAKETEMAKIRQAEHPHSLGRRHRLVEHQLQQPWPDGLPDPEHRPHRERRRGLHRLLRPAKLHRGPRRLHHRAESDPHRPDQGRNAGSLCRPPRGRSDHRGTAEAAGIRHRPVRQEPSGRSGRISADRARLRRILRQPLPPQRRRGTRAGGLSERPGLQAALRPQGRAARLGGRQGRTEDRGYRSTHQEAHGDHR